MKIEIEVTPEQLAQLFATFIESSDPVTSAWCPKVRPWHAEAWGGNDYAAADFWSGKFAIRVFEYDESAAARKKRATTEHVVNDTRVAAGLAVMAARYGHLFQRIHADNIDQPCADIFMQCVLFGEEKYA